MRPSPTALANAVVVAVAATPDGRDADALAAFILAWRHHWPTSFETELAARAPHVEAWAARHTQDADRYLKLRRIALENLADVL